MILLLLIAASAFSGCGAMKSFAVGEINYNGNIFKLIYDWKINPDAPYESVVIEQDNMSLKCRLYDSGGKVDFILYEDSGELYHNPDAELPENNTESIKSLSMAYNDKDKDKTTSDPAVISELCDMISHEEYTANPGDVNYICEVGISYKDCPASNWCINLNDNKDNQLWVTKYNFNLPDKNPNHTNLYKAPDDSKLYQFVKQ